MPGMFYGLWLGKVGILAVNFPISQFLDSSILQFFGTKWRHKEQAWRMALREKPSKGADM